MDSFDWVVSATCGGHCRVPNFRKRVSETKTGTRVPLFQTFFPPAFSPNRAYISPVTIDKAAGADRMRLIKLMIYAQPRPNRGCLFLLHFHVRSTETNCAQNRIYEPIDIHAAVCSLSQSIPVPKNCFISWFRLTDLFAFTLFFFRRLRRVRFSGSTYLKQNEIEDWDVLEIFIKVFVS